MESPLRKSLILLAAGVGMVTFSSCVTDPYGYSGSYAYSSYNYSSYPYGYTANRLPYGYNSVVIGGTKYWHCNDHYYRHYPGRGYVVVRRPEGRPRPVLYSGGYNRYDRHDYDRNRYKDRNDWLKDQRKQREKWEKEQKKQREKWEKERRQRYEKTNEYRRNSDHKIIPSNYRNQSNQRNRADDQRRRSSGPQASNPRVQQPRVPVTTRTPTVTRERERERVEEESSKRRKSDHRVSSGGDRSRRRN